MNDNDQVDKASLYNDCVSLDRRIRDMATYGTNHIMKMVQCPDNLLIENTTKEQLDVWLGIAEDSVKNIPELYKKEYIELYKQIYKFAKKHVKKE
ncbi:MAG: hypothetical protein AABY32_03920 [Nanoarchaeota archaeon]